MKHYLEPISKEQLKITHDEFGATEESLKNDVDILMEWLEKQPHLPNVKDAEWLTHFLLCCKNSIERSKQKLDAYFTAKALNPAVFTNRKELLKCAVDFSKVMCFIPLPKLTNDGTRVLVFRVFPGSHNFNVTSELLLHFAQLEYDLLMKTDCASKFIMTFDMENMTIPIMAACFPAMKKLLDQITKINPIRIQKFYSLNVSSAVEPLVNFSISLLSKKLASRTIVWKKKAKELIEDIDEHVLPSIYGGTERSLEELRGSISACKENETGKRDKLFILPHSGNWRIILAVRFHRLYGTTDAHMDWLVSVEGDVADLSKKPTDSGVPTDIGDYGVEGTFRKINLD